MRILALLLLSLSLTLQAQDEKVPPPAAGTPPQSVTRPAEEDPFGGAEIGRPTLIQVQVEFVDVSHEKLTELLFMKTPSDSNAGELRQKVQDLVKNGSATIMETQLVVGRSGEKSTSESIDEAIYPTEAEPSSIPNSVALPEKKDSIDPDNIKALAALIGPVTPTSFETRNVGSTLEIEPTLGNNGDKIDLRLQPDLVWKTGRTLWQERKDPLGNVSKIETPQFYSLRISTALTVKVSQYVLAGIASPKDQDGNCDFSRKVMIFVKADVLEVK